MRRESWLHLAALAICCFLIAAIALGLSYQRYTAMIPGQSIFRGLSKDGWVAQGAVLRFPRLANIGNRLLLQFNGWRPVSYDSHVRLTLCQQTPTEHLIGSDTALLLSLRAECEPKRLQFEIVNPFKVSPTDPRELGAQLIRSEVTSRFGIAIVAPWIAATTGMLLFILALTVYYCFKAAAFRCFSWLVPLAAFYPLTRVDIQDLSKPCWLWMTCFCVAGGFLLARISESAGETEDEPLALREWNWLPVLAIFAGAAAIRFYRLDFGLPYNYHPDEIPKANAIMQMVASHSFNPRYFLHPSLLLYCTYFINTVFHWLGVTGDFRETAFLAGRCVSALAGSLSILFVYAIATRLFSQRAGVISAALLAVFPLHVTCSRYLKEDSLLVFFILAATWAVIKAAQENRRGLLFLAAVFAGLAASTKYSGVLAIGIVLSAPWLRSKSLKPDPVFARSAILAAMLVPFAFFAASPYILLDRAKFLSDFSYERKHALRGHTQAIDAWSQYWMYHLARSIVPGIGTLTTMTALLGIGLLLWRRRIADLYILGLVLAFYLPAEWVKSKPEPQPERYIFPCLPFLAIAAAHFVEVLARGRFKRFVPALALLLIGAPLLRTLQLARDLSQDTREIAAQWLLENVPEHSKVLIDWQPYGPNLPPEKLPSENILRINVLKKLTPQALKDSGADYLVLSSLFYDRYFTQPFANPVFQNRFKVVFSRVPILKEISAPSGSYGFHNPRLTIFSLKPQDFAALDAEIALKSAGKLTKTQNEERASLRWLAH